MSYEKEKKSPVTRWPHISNVCMCVMTVAKAEKVVKDFFEFLYML